MNVNEVGAAIDEMSALLRLDGADLRMLGVDPKTARVEVELDMSGVECEECVMPADLLEQMIRDAVAKRVRGEFELVLHDPRRAEDLPRS